MVVSVSDIAIPNISDELVRLWDQEQGQDKIRATLFNLIVYVQGKEKIKEYEALVKRVISKFPSRVIFLITNDKPGEDDLNVSVTSETIGEGDLKIFCEMIRIEANGQYIERVPYLVIPQMLADLPVYLLWTQDPCAENAILPHLEPFATRIIFNSESTNNLQGFATSVLSLSRQFRCDVGDLNWDAIEGWRRLLMETFNSKEHFFRLGQAHHVIITYNKHEDQEHHHTEIQAAYLQGWLAARLNWALESFELVEGNVRLCYRRPMNEVVVLLRPKEEPKLAPGAILSIELQTSKEGGHYLFERHFELPQVTVHYTDKERCDFPNHCYLACIPVGQEIVQEIFYPKGKEHYQMMLQTISQTPWRVP